LDEGCARGGKVNLLLSLFLKRVIIVILGLLLSVPHISEAATNKPSPKSVTSKKSKKTTYNWLNLKFTWEGATKSWEPPPRVPYDVMVGNGRVWFEYKCRNLNEYLNFGPGTRATITDEKSTVLDADNLFWDYTFKEAKWINYLDGIYLEKFPCYLEQNFKIPIRKFYGIKIGDETLYTVSHKELQDNEFQLVLSKGK
jgi:hypothetical protein